jgi:penicillin-binding protein 2
MVVRFPEDQRPPSWKIVSIQYVIAGAFAVLVFGYWRLQIAEHRFYQREAERNRTRDLPIIAPRGRILDRQGRVLVDNYPAFSVLLLREDVGKLTPDDVKGIAEGLDLKPEDVQQVIDKAADLPKFQPVMLKIDATSADIAFVESHQIEYPELELLQVQQRFYLKHQVAAAMLGYVGQVSEEMIAKSGNRYRPGDVVGKSGIEREYNAVLSGRDGMRRVIVNSRGQDVGSLTTVNAVPGNDLRLTIDFDLQMAAETALGDRSGAVVALDPNTGEVLALVSHPTFDPNDFAHHIDPAEWAQLRDNPDHPLLDKAIQAQLAPGSVFKIVTATAALETGTITPAFTVMCPGYVTIYGHTFHDWIWKYHRGHGDIDLHRAIVESCDVYFYTLGKMLGIDKMAYFARHLGLGARTGIDLPSEDPGLVPTPGWVERVFKHMWYPGETIPVAIGQGALEVTPIQLAHMIGGVALGGVFHRPHLVFPDELQALGQDPPSPAPTKFPLTPETVAAVTSGMWGVVNEGGGTGAGARIAGLDIAGKTGTAQVVSVALKNAAHKANYRNNAWFVGYAPANQPQIVVAVLVMHGGESSVATPVAGAVIKAYFQEKSSGHAPATRWQTQASVESAVPNSSRMQGGAGPR